MDISKIKLIAPYSVEGVQNSTIKEAYIYLRKCKVVTVDTETCTHPLYKGIGSGLDPYTSMLISLQIGDENQQFIIDTRYIHIGLISNILTSKRIVKLGVNLKFDYKIIKHHLGIDLVNLYDIGLAEAVLTCGKSDSWSLASIAKKYLNIDLYTNQLSLFDSYVSKNTVKDYEKLEYDNLTLDLIKYSAADIVIPSLAYPKILRQIRKDRLSKAVELENKFTRIVAKWELKGIKLDPTKWLDLLASHKKELAEVEYQLNQYLIYHNMEEFLGSNWNSSKQVAPIFKHLNIPIQIIDKQLSIGGEKVYKNTVGKDHVKKFKDKFNILPLYLEYKRLQTAINTFGFKFLSNVNPISKRVHTDIYQILNTGRISSSKPNMQNIPGTKEFRACFVAENKKKFVICDYDSQESRILADYANEPSMLDYVINGDGNFHNLTAIRLFGEVTPENRRIAKMLNFAIAYGASDHRISDSAQVSLKQAQEWIDMFYEKYPALKPYFEKQHKLSIQKGYHIIDNVTKRRSYLSNYDTYTIVNNFIQESLLYHPTYKIPSKVWSVYFKLKGSYERDAQNYLIQGTGGSMTKLAAVLFDAQMEKLGWLNRAQIVNIIHDEFVVECDEAIVNKVSKILAKCMSEAGKVFIKKIPMTASPKISDFWIK